MRHFDAGRHLEFIQRYMPAPAKIVEDNANGRYLVAYPDVGRRSFSWTRRGQKACVAVILEHLWQCHEFASGVGSPFNIREVLGPMEDGDR